MASAWALWLFPSQQASCPHSALLSAVLVCPCSLGIPRHCGPPRERPCHHRAGAPHSTAGAALTARPVGCQRQWLPSALPKQVSLVPCSPSGLTKEQSTNLGCTGKTVMPKKCLEIFPCFFSPPLPSLPPLLLFFFFPSFLSVIS